MKILWVIYVSAKDNPDTFRLHPTSFLAAETAEIEADRLRKIDEDNDYRVDWFPVRN